jgi:hypothetical protein
MRHARLCAIAVVLGALAAPAMADPRQVVVVEFEGPNAHPVQAAVEAMLTDEHFTVETDQTANDAPHVTGKLVRNRRKHFILTVKIGDQVVSVVDLGRAGKLAKADATKLRRALVAQLEALAPAPKPPPAAPPPTEPAKEPEPAPAPVTTPPVTMRPVTTPPVTTPPSATTAPTSTPPATRDGFHSFALVRHALPWNEVALRAYRDTRKVDGFEQVIGFRAPLDFSLFARTTLRSSVGGTSDLTTFQLDAFLWSPMVYSVGAVVVVGGTGGPGNDSIRPGIGQTLLVTTGSLRVFTLLAVTFTDSVRPGGGVTTAVNVTLGPARAEVFGIFGLGHDTKPFVVAFRPDLRIRVWKSFGVFVQYDVDTSATIGSPGLRAGAELGIQL